MFNKKPLILGLASLLLASGLASCGGGEAAADLTYWCPSVDTDIMATLVNDFKAAYPQYADKNIALDANYGEDKAYAALHKNLEAAADVILMADDNIREAVNAEELSTLTEYKAAMAPQIGDEAINSCSIGTELYGLAYRADNSPMPIYDKTVFADATKLNSLEGMLEACKAAGKKFYFDIGNGWYNPFLFWTGGAQFTAGKDSKNKDVLWNDVMAHIDDVAATLEAVKGLYNRYIGTWEVNSDAGTIEGAFKNGCAGVAFLWNDTSTIKGLVNNANNIATAMWPTLTVNGAAKQLKCFKSFKAVVVKDMEDGDRKTLAKEFANFLASKSAQEKRITIEYGPSNLELQRTDAVKNLDFAGKVQKMSDDGRTVNQATNVTGAFWNVMAAMGAVLSNGLATGTAKAWGTKNNAVDYVAQCVSTAGWENHTF